jgi:winged helix-turn helix protein
MSQRTFRLSPDEQRALERLRDTAPKAYLRERAAAVLKVAAGIPAARVARDGLLRARDPDSVYAWLDRFAAAGPGGLTIRPGRGRKPAFSPPAPDR